jgi:hypothetical protein
VVPTPPEASQTTSPDAPAAATGPRAGEPGSVECAALHALGLSDEQITRYLRHWRPPATSTPERNG